MKRLTHQERHDRRKAIADAVRSGKTIEATSRQFKVTVTTVKGACKAFDVTWPDTEKRVDSLAIVGALQAGAKVAAVAAQFCVSRQYVSEVRKRAIEAGVTF